MPTETQLEQRVAALQSDLNTKDEQIDALTFSDNDRELSRRDWFEAAQVAERQVEVLEGLLREVVSLDPRGEFLGWKLDGKIDAALSASAGPSAPKCETCNDHGEIGGLRPDGYDSEPCPDCAVPSAPVERDERADFEAYALGRGWLPKHLAEKTASGNYKDWAVNPEWQAWKARAAMDCPDCGDTGLEPCAKHGWKP